MDMDVDIKVDVDVAHLGRSGRVSGKHPGCDRLDLGSGGGRTSRQEASRKRTVSRDAW
jgi:hypothetical protein